ncbi:unnamed protein product [Adineta ricciae]|uniref:Uncharacterized protein n=1 Tax=Adineta ricciae TaxID=249248 RepID=A0A816CE62_ADIRI|nr:unnamed protein product [Adineta ricciae]
MNFTLIRQREVQQGFFSQRQVTLFTIHLTVGREQRNVAIISDYMEHITSFVYCAQQILVRFIKKNFPLTHSVNSILLFSDGASGHFKNNVNICNLIHHKIDFELVASWTFTSTGHGKSAGNGIGATLSKNILLSIAKDFFEFSQKQQLEIAKKSNRDNPAVDVFNLEADEIEKVKNNILNSRFEKLQALHKIQGIRGLHEFQPISDTTVQCRSTSLSTKIKTHSFK